MNRTNKLIKLFSYIIISISAFMLLKRVTIKTLAKARNLQTNNSKSRAVGTVLTCSNYIMHKNQCVICNLILGSS